MRVRQLLLEVHYNSSGTPNANATAMRSIHLACHCLMFQSSNYSFISCNSQTLLLYVGHRITIAPQSLTLLQIHFQDNILQFIFLVRKLCSFSNCGFLFTISLFLRADNFVYYFSTIYHQISVVVFFHLKTTTSRTNADKKEKMRCFQSTFN